MNLLILLFVPLVLACGQICFKYVAIQVGTQTSVGGYLNALLTTPFFYAAIVVYSCSTLLWIYALTRVPLTYAYPFVALAFIVVPLINYFTLKEAIDMRLAVGSAIIVVGVIVISWGRVG